MYYPERVLRTRKYKLIQNLNYRMPFPIDQDLYLAPTFRELLNKSISHLPTKWYKSIISYYYRPEYEFFDVVKDPEELDNLSDQPKLATVFAKLKRKLSKWRNLTDDPWICAPGAVLENTGIYRYAPQCLPLYNDA